MPEPYQHILIVKLGAFGDVIIAQRRIDRIRAEHPTARLTVLTTPPYAELMGRNPHVARVVTTRRTHRLKFWELLKARRMLRSLDVDFIYDLQGTGRAQMYCKWVGRDVPLHRGRGGIFENEADDAGVIELDWLADPVDELLTEHGVTGRFILLIPGCSARNAYKRWPHYAELAERLSAAGHTCVTAPGPDEVETCRAVPATMLMNRQADGATSPLSIPQLAGLARKADYAIGNDTGPTHLCAFTGTPGVAIFGPFTPPSQVGIDRVWPIIETDDLNSLPAQRVLDHALAHLPISPRQSNDV